MKKIVSSLLRYVLIFVAVIAGCICAVSIVGIILASSTGSYSNKLDEAVNNGSKNLSELYSEYIFENMKDSDNPGCMAQSNLRYVIVKGINPGKDMDSKENKAIIRNKNNIVYTNIGLYGESTDKFNYDNFMVFYGQEPADYEKIGLLTSLFYERDMDNRHKDYKSYEQYEEYVHRIFYKDGIFYLETENYAFPAYSVEIPASSLDNADYKLLKDSEDISDITDYVNYELECSKDGRLFYRCPWFYSRNMVLDASKYTQWDEIIINEIPFKTGIIEKGEPGSGIKIFEWDRADNYYLCNLENMENYSENMEGYSNLAYLDILISYEIEDNTNNNVYAVLTSIASPLDKKPDDLFYMQKQFIKFLYSIRYTSIMAAVVSALIFIVLLILCCYSRYSCSGNDKTRNNMLHHIPFLIYTAFLVLLAYADIALGIEWLKRPLKYTSEINLLLVFCFLAALCVMACIFLFIMFCMETSCRAGAGIFLKTTLLYSVFNIFKKISAPLKDAYNKADRNTSLFVKTSLILVLVNLILLSGFFLNVVYSGEYFIFFAAVIICAVFDFFILKFILQMEALQIHAREMAAGNLENKTDTSKMGWEFKKHGEYLNQIGEGMAAAVDEKIKSEHFKTELITNVSHDIKTPLTSIINYVDLLKKEDIQHPKAKEYIEVLDRQSARLKKLIEDLMEASKASTGNINVELELCNINILLTQTLGEFEEKLNDKELELVINKSPEDVFIMADNRHIWRIFDNLMNNICKYGQKGTRVYINIEPADENVIIIFRNTSSYQLNISSDELLERFVRGDSSRHTEGSGLGLSIAQNLAEVMGGSLGLHVDGDLFKVVLEFPRAIQP